MGKDYGLERMGRKENGKDGGMCGRWFRKQVVASFCSTIVQYSKVTGEMVSNISMNGGGEEIGRVRIEGREG